MKTALIILLILLFTMVVACSPGPVLTEEFEATVVEITVSAGSFGSPTVYMVGFDNGKKLALHSAELVVGNKYYIKCYFSRLHGRWIIKTLELLEKQ